MGELLAWLFVIPLLGMAWGFLAILAIIIYTEIKDNVGS